jgi:DNA polymerase III alpha subunit
MTKARFACVRTHSWYSLPEGVSSPEALLARAAEAGYAALALTDTNSLAGAVEFYEAARGFGVRPLLGATLARDRLRLTALAAEPAGYRSLCRAVTRLRGPKPPALPQLLAECAEGLHLLCDDPHLFKPPLTDAFRGRLWAEVIRPGRSEAAEGALLEAAFRVGARPVASLGCYLATPGEHAAYRLLGAVRRGVTLDQLPAALPVLPGHHLADPDDVAARWRDLPDALANASKLAEICREDVLPRGTLPLPAQVPQGQTAAGYLRLLCERALPLRGFADEAAARRRLEQELAVIGQLDMAAYFLAAGEIAAEARKQHWPTSLRGSAAASLVCYLLGVSDVDPVRHGLRLERFLHPGRCDPPDIDLECADQVRGRLWAAILKRYGPTHVARVGSVHRLQPRSAFEAAALAHGLTRDQVAGLLEELGDNLVKGLREGETPARLAAVPPGWPAAPEAWPRVLADARLLLGRPRELSSHPSAFVLCGVPAADVLPLEPRPEGAGLSQLGKEGVERIGLATFDLLSSKALSTLAGARELAKVLASPDEAARAAQPAEDSDPATLALLARGDTLGVGQLETPALRRLLRQLRPRSLSDVVHALALARPALSAAKNVFLRRRHGAEAPAVPHPMLGAVLRESYGLPLFEDDLIAVIEALTGLPGGEADQVRRRLTGGGGDREAQAAFLAACEANGVPRPAAEQVLRLILPFTGYAFCKSHAVSVALIAWQECYLKAHQPAAFWAAALNHHEGGYPRRTYVEDAKRAGLAVCGPCVNRSQRGWTQEVTALRAGLEAVRALSGAAAQAVLDERARAGPFASFKDFARRVALTPQDVGLLVRVGALDFAGQSRDQLLLEAKAAGQGRLPTRLREEAEPWPLELPEGHPLARQWRDEWELLGWLPGAPLMHLLRPALPRGLADSRSLPDLVGRKVRLAGLVGASKELRTEEGPLEFVTLEDEFGLAEVHVPPHPGEPDPEGQGPLVVAEGEVEERHGVPFLASARLERALPGASPGSAVLPAVAGVDVRANGAAKEGVKR